LPFVSQSQAPSPRANATGLGEYVCITCDELMRFSGPLKRERRQSRRPGERRQGVTYGA
jgi:hypothetical protein